MKAFCYYEPIAGEQFDEHGPMVQSWRRNWSRLGWVPMVLTEVQARSHAAYRRWSSAVPRLASINHRDYQRACFVRWLALAEILRPGESAVFVDYDVFNVSFTPADARQLASPDQVTNLHYGQCSQPVILDYRQAQALPAVLMELTQALNQERPEQQDWNDMSFWEADKKRSLGFARYLDICLPYVPEVEAPMIHLSWEAVDGAGSRKSQVWKELEALYGT